MIDRHQRIQALYEISLSISPKETLEATADDALLGYLQKLNCSVGAIFHHRSTPDGDGYDAIATIPATVESNETLKSILDALPDATADQSLGEQLPITGYAADDAYFCLFELPSFGVLAIGKYGGQIDDLTRSALRPVNKKLAEACRSKLIEQQHRIERNRFEAVFDAIPEPVVNTIVDDGIERVKRVNTTFETTFGYSEATASGQPIDSLVGPTDTDAEPSDNASAATTAPRTVTHQTVDGPREFLFRRVAVGCPGAEEYIQLYVDISVQKQHQRELERYERLVENLPIGVYRTTPGPDGEFRLVNQGLADILEADSVSAFETLSVSDLYTGATTRKQFSDHLLEQGSTDGVELELQTLNGNPIWVSIAGRAVEEDGETVFELTLQDVTERKERQQQLAVLNRVLRHNLRNAMNVIKGNTRLLSEAVDSQLDAHVEAIEQRVERLERLSDKAGTMRTLFEQGREVTATVDVGELLAELEDDFASSYPNAQLTVETFDPVSVQADVRLKLALFELFDNAVEHNDDPNPTVTVRVTSAESKPAEGWVSITIADNGPGIPRNEWQAIESGEETPLQHGTGLGLWLVYWTVSLLGGEISMSNVGAGSEVVLRLPRPTARRSTEQPTD